MDTVKLNTIRYSPKGVGFRLIDLTNPWNPARVPLVFQHGLGLDSRAWLPWIRRVSADRACIAIDMRGHGASKPIWKAPSLDLEDYAQDIDDVLQSLGIVNCIFVGESFGGTVGLYLAVTRPQLIRGIAVASTGWRGDLVNNISDWPSVITQKGGLKTWSDMILSGSFDYEKDDKKIIDWAETCQLDVMPEAAAALVTTLRKADLGPKLDQLTMPVLNFVAQKSPFVDLEQARILKERLPNYLEAPFPDAKHRLFLSNPEPCCEIFEEWLENLD
jgi:3-oxoadipate enol-lactonase